MTAPPQTLAGKPFIGAQVHYVARGSADGHFPATCRTATITEVSPDVPTVVGLMVANPTGLFFHPIEMGGVDHDAGAGTPGREDCPTESDHGNPLRYCGCGWTEPHLVGGTWHWPEPVDQ